MTGMFSDNFCINYTVGALVFHGCRGGFLCEYVTNFVGLKFCIE